VADEFALRQRVERAARAKSLLENDLLNEFFDNVRESLLAVFEKSDLGNDAERRHAREALGILTNIRAQMPAMIAKGDYSAKELLRLEKESKLKRMMKRA